MNLDVILWARDICPENGIGALPESSSKYAGAAFCHTKNYCSGYHNHVFIV
jgi:hypothetical protein